MYTHDKHGRPLSPAVFQVLNEMTIPKHPKAKIRHPRRMARDVPFRADPRALGDVPGLEDEVKPRFELRLAPTPSAAAVSVSPIHGRANIISSPVPTRPLVPRKRDPLPLRLLRALLAPLPSSIIDTQTEKPADSGSAMDIVEIDPMPVSEQWEPAGSLAAPVDEVPLEQYYNGDRPRSYRLNSDYYRVLAMELAMCRHGKLRESIVSIARTPSSSPANRPCRNWQELSADDFKFDEETDEEI